MTRKGGKPQPHKFEGVQHRANFASLRAQTVMIRIPELGQIACSPKGLESMAFAALGRITPKLYLFGNARTPGRKKGGHSQTTKIDQASSVT